MELYQVSTQRIMPPLACSTLQGRGGRGGRGGEGRAGGEGRKREGRRRRREEGREGRGGEGGEKREGKRRGGRGEEGREGRRRGRREGPLLHVYTSGAIQTHSCCFTSLAASTHDLRRAGLCISQYHKLTAVWGRPQCGGLQ